MLSNPALLSVLIGLVAAVAAGAVAYVLQLRRAEVIPALPSRIETVDKSEAVVRYFGAAHDITNTITSAWNHARATAADDTMLRELERPILGEHIEIFREAALILWEELGDHTQLNSALSSAYGALEESWSYYRNDHFRTETYYTTDAKGNRQMHTRQVFMHTSHDFTFQDGAASAAEQELSSLLASTNENELYGAATAQLEVTFTEDDRIRAWETVYEGGDEKPTDEEVFAAMDAWNDSALAQHNISTAKQHVGVLRQRATLHTFRKIRRSRSTYHYTSYGGPGSTHQGPDGYRATQSLLSPVESAHNSLSELFSAMSTSDEHVSEIHRMWEEQGRFTEKDSGDLAKTFLNHGIEMYEELFPKSKITYDQRIKSGRTIAIAAVTGIVAGLVSYAIQVI